MKILASLGRAAGAWLGLPSRESLGLPIATGALTPGESIPTLRLVNAPANLAPAAPSASIAPVASAPVEVPKFRKAPVDHEGLTAYQRKIQHEARLKSEFGWHEKLEAAGSDVKARRKVWSDFDRYIAARPLGMPATPPNTAAKSTPDATDDDGVPQPVDPESDPSLPAIIQQLQDILDTLKKRLAPTPDETDDEAKALSALKAGKKLTACQLLMAVTKNYLQRAQAYENMSSRERTAMAFNSQDTVAALNRALRVKPSVLPPRMDPVTSKVSATDVLARYREIEAEITKNDLDQKKYGISSARQSKHAALRMEQAALRSRLHAK
jgi:hypothetical protein